MKIRTTLSFLLLVSLYATAQNPVATYPFTINADDASGNGYNGTLFNGATAYDTLSIGDNNLDYVSLPSLLLTGLNDFTITFLVKFSHIHTAGSYPANTVMHAWGLSNQDELKLSYNHNSSVFQVSVKTNQVTFPFIAIEDQWYCFCIIRHGIGISLYIDGVQTGIISNSASGSLSPSATGFVLGQEEDCQGGCFVTNQSLAGKLDELNFYNYAFNLQQISSCNTQMLAPSFASSDTALCEKFCIDFFDQSTNNPTGWMWIFPGGSPSSSTDQNPANICYAIPGSYDVTLITSGPAGMDTVTLSNFITVNATPPFPVITQSGNTLTSSAANSYQWQLNSTDIPGATNQSYVILQAGFYTVLIGDSNGCKNSTSVDVGLTAIDPLTATGAYTMYPNPADEFTMIKFPFQKTIVVSVVNELGEVIEMKPCENASFFTLPAATLDQGIYLVKLISGNETLFTEKLWIAH